MRTKRNDLLAQTIVMPQMLIGGILAPRLVKRVKAGSFYKITPGGAANIAVNRLPGATVVASNNTGTEVLYSCAETSDRQAIDESEIPMAGGEARYQLGLARTSVVNVAKKAELKVKNALYALTAMANEATLYETIVAAADTLRLLGGRIALAGSSTMLQHLRRNTTIRDALKNTGIVPANVDPRFISNEVLAAALNISMVLEGRADIWPATGLALEIVPDTAFEPSQELQAARTPQFVAGVDDNGNDIPVEVYEGYDDSTKSNYIDAEEFTQCLVLNSTMIKIIDAEALIAAESASS